jgi:hypothetical protein
LLPIVIDPPTLPVADGAKFTFSAVVCPGAKAVLALAPLTANPAPVTTTLEIVTFALPVLLNITPSGLLLPTGTLPKSKLVVLALSTPIDAMPLPLAEIARGEFGALLASKIEPVTFPPDFGVNTTLNVALWPAAMLIGTVRPDVLNPAPNTFTLEIVTPAFPPFCNVIVCELLDPIVTAGKLAFMGTAESCGCGVLGGGGTGEGGGGGRGGGGGSTAGAGMPLPLVEIASGEFGALLAREIEPVAFPAEFGVNTTLNVVFWPAAMLIGNVRPDVLNPAPTTFASEIVTLALPPFCSVMV